MRIGIKINQGEHLEELIRTAAPIVRDVFKQIYGTNYKVRVMKVKRGDEPISALIFVDAPEPNGTSLELLSRLDRELYVPLVENSLSSMGYDFMIGNKKIEDVWGLCALTQIAAQNGNKEDARRMAKQYLATLGSYGIRQNN